MEASEILKKLDRIDDLPTLPAIAMEVNKMLDDYNTSIKDLSNAIEKDQSIASKILKLVNSAFFGLSSKVSNIPHAITLLGFNTVRNAVVSVSIMKSLPSEIGHEELDIKEFWTHSVGVAVTSRHLAEKSKTNNPDDCFITGLLHDLGKIVLAQYFPELFKRAWETVRSNGLTFYEAEKQENPVDHARIGAYMAKRWNLPFHLIDTIRYHHSMSKNAHDANLLMIVHFADIILNNYMKTPGSNIDLASSHVSASADLKGSFRTTPDWFPETANEIESACKFFLEELD